MQPVDNLTQAMQVLRRQMAENLERLRSKGKPGNESAPAAAKSGAAAGAVPVREAVERRIKSIDPDDPRWLEKAAQGFVESVLLAEFGEGRINDPAFRDLISRVQETMLADSALAHEVSQLTTRIRQS